MVALDRLEALAKVATPGPWGMDDGNVFSCPISNANYAKRSEARRKGEPQPPRDEYDGEVAKCSQELPNFDEDSTFIAACDPQTVIRLVAALRASATYLAAEETGTVLEADIAANALRAALAALETP